MLNNQTTTFGKSDYEQQINGFLPIILAASLNALQLQLLKFAILVLMNNTSTPHGLHLLGFQPPLQLPFQVTVKHGDLLPGNKRKIE